jgi:hypothetical protein
MTQYSDDHRHTYPKIIYIILQDRFDHPNIQIFVNQPENNHSGSKEEGIFNCAFKLFFQLHKCKLKSEPPGEIAAGLQKVHPVGPGRKINKTFDTNRVKILYAVHGSSHLHIAGKRDAISRRK